MSGRIESPSSVSFNWCFMPKAGEPGQPRFKMPERPPVCPFCFGGGRTPGNYVCLSCEGTGIRGGKKPNPKPRSRDGEIEN